MTGYDCAYQKQSNAFAKVPLKQTVVESPAPLRGFILMQELIRSGSL